MVAMPTKKYVWKATDKAASYLIQCLVAESHLGYTGIERASNGEIGYNRVRDLCLGLKAPARLSEFLLICDICKADPIIVLRKVLETAAGQPFIPSVDAVMDDVYADAVTRAMRKEERARSAGAKRIESVNDEQSRVAETLNKLRRGDLDIAAYEDEHKYDGDGDEPA